MQNSRSDKLVEATPMGGVRIQRDTSFSHYNITDRAHTSTSESRVSRLPRIRYKGFIRIEVENTMKKEKEGEKDGKTRGERTGKRGGKKRGKKEEKREKKNRRMFSLAFTLACWITSLSFLIIVLDSSIIPFCFEMSSSSSLRARRVLITSSTHPAVADSKRDCIGYGSSKHSKNARKKILR